MTPGSSQNSIPAVLVLGLISILFLDLLSEEISTLDSMDLKFKFRTCTTLCRNGPAA